ncbi:hypothetical protein [Rhodothermus marinus]|uniref:hypothetical protein n=1 Tax=Rhodothermus marinus TaxID=29549 RepID=UPI0006D1549D|nr:hypothetical protein [Rhodothermus marinus]
MQAPASLRQDIIRLINLRRNYLGGTMVVLSEVGNPWPSADVADVFVARRGGNGTRSGAILVLNDHETDTKGLWVDSSPSGWPNWAGKDLINPETGETTHIYDDGRVYVWAPPRDYAIWVLQEEYEAGLLAADVGEPCTLAQIASQTVSGNQGVATFYSPDGIRELQFTLLDNLTVVSVQGAGGERFSPVEGGRYTLDDGQEPPVYVEVVFQQVDPAVSHGTYYAWWDRRAPTRRTDCWKPIWIPPCASKISLSISDGKDRLPIPLSGRHTLSWRFPKRHRCV